MRTASPEGPAATRCAAAEGNDNIAGGPANDRMIGGTGNDTLQGGTGNDAFDGGDGIDHAFHFGVIGGLSVDLSLAGPQAAAAARATTT